jgi:hypothetical protein
MKKTFVLFLVCCAVISCRSIKLPYEEEGGIDENSAYLLAGETLNEQNQPNVMEVWGQYSYKGKPCIDYRETYTKKSRKIDLNISSEFIIGENSLQAEYVRTQEAKTLDAFYYTDSFRFIYNSMELPFTKNDIDNETFYFSLEIFGKTLEGEISRENLKNFDLSYGDVKITGICVYDFGKTKYDLMLGQKHLYGFISEPREIMMKKRWKLVMEDFNEEEITLFLVLMTLFR